MLETAVLGLLLTIIVSAVGIGYFSAHVSMWRRLALWTCIVIIVVSGSLCASLLIDSIALTLEALTSVLGYY